MTHKNEIKLYRYIGKQKTNQEMYEKLFVDPFKRKEIKNEKRNMI